MDYYRPNISLNFIVEQLINQKVRQRWFRLISCWAVFVLGILLIGVCLAGEIVWLQN